MPMHDWTKVEAGTYHSFHLRWIASIMVTLNAGLLPNEYIAMAEKHVSKYEPDVVALENSFEANGEDEQDYAGGTALLTKPVVAKIIETDPERYARRTSRIAIRRGLGKTVAVIELVSPRNKQSRNEIDGFTAKCRDFLRMGIHLLVVDSFPPTTRDPLGLHPLIWEDRSREEYELPADQRLSLLSYDSTEVTAYINYMAIGDALPTMPIFLRSPGYVNVPLEATYQTTWNALPRRLQNMIVAGKA